MKNKPRDVMYCGVSRKKIAKANPELNIENMIHLCEFITERSLVHIKKDCEHRGAPWTKNPILQQYKFTNVRRENDRVSKALIKLVSTNPYLSYREKVLNTFLFRSWNNPDTFVDLCGPFTASEIYDPAFKEKVRPIYNKLQAEDPDRKWWSSAYNQGGMKSAWKYPDEDALSKPANNRKAEMDIPLRVFHIGNWMDQKNTFDKVVDAKTQAEAYNAIRELRGFSDFLAYQVFVDLTYIEQFPFSENEFVISGPGCERGLNLIFEDFDGMNLEEALFWLRDNQEAVFGELHSLTCGKAPEWRPDIIFSDLPKNERRLSVMSIENCMCELSKYVKATKGIGRPKVRYPGRG